MGGLNPGRLRDLIQIHKITRTSDGRGGTTATEALLFETFAEITPMKPITVIENGKMTVHQPYGVIIRFRPDAIVQPDMKVTYKQDRYLIKNIVNSDTRTRRVNFIMTKA